jgi:hypothetical protein
MKIQRLLIGGEITLAPEYTGGSRFILTIPMK